MLGEPPSVKMERRHALVIRNEVWFSSDQVTLIISKCRRVKWEHLMLGLLGYWLCCAIFSTTRSICDSGHGLWSIRETILGICVILMISAELWFCWKSWIAACCPVCRCSLVLLLPGDNMPQTSWICYLQELWRNSLWVPANMQSKSASETAHWWWVCGLQSSRTGLFYKIKIQLWLGTTFLSYCNWLMKCLCKVQWKRQAR